MKKDLGFLGERAGVVKAKKWVDSSFPERHHFWVFMVKVKIAQSYPTICDPVDYTVHGILQARILEWVPVPFSRASSQPRDQTRVCHIAGGFFTS